MLAARSPAVLPEMGFRMQVIDVEVVLMRGLESLFACLFLKNAHDKWCIVNNLWMRIHKDQPRLFQNLAKSITRQLYRGLLSATPSPALLETCSAGGRRKKEP
jgi:hypothetical protein